MRPPHPDSIPQAEPTIAATVEPTAAVVDRRDREEAGSSALLPAWLDAEDGVPPEPLRRIYSHLDPAVTRICERARRAMRQAYVEGLREVHAALAPSGLFKDWCEAAGISYHTAKNTVWLAKQAEKEREKQETGYSTGTRSPAQQRDQRTPKPEPVSADENAAGGYSPDPDKPSSSRICLTYAEREYEEVVALLRALGQAWGLDDHSAIVARAVCECLSRLPHDEGSAGSARSGGKGLVDADDLP